MGVRSRIQMESVGKEGRRGGRRGEVLLGGAVGVMIYWGRGVILMVCWFSVSKRFRLKTCCSYTFFVYILSNGFLFLLLSSFLLGLGPFSHPPCLTSTVSNMLTSTSYDYHCHSNLTRAILPYGLTEFDVHDVLNVFQVTGLDAEGRYFMEASPATENSFIDFFAEQDLLCALSTCPGGDLSAWGWSQAEEGDVREGGEGQGDEGMKSTCRPIKVEVWEIKSEEREHALEGWKVPEKSGYKGLHGMNVPGGEA